MVAALALGLAGYIWHQVRHQHPHQHPHDHPHDHNYVEPRTVDILALALAQLEVRQAATAETASVVVAQVENHQSQLARLDDIAYRLDVFESTPATEERRDRTWEYWRLKAHVHRYDTMLGDGAGWRCGICGAVKPGD